MFSQLKTVHNHLKNLKDNILKAYNFQVPYLMQLREAITKQDQAKLKSLLKREILSDADTLSRVEALHFAILRQDLDMVSPFFKYGPKINFENNIYDHLLFEAIRVSSIEIVELLLKKGARVNRKNECGQPPLYYAVMISREKAYLNVRKTIEFYFDSKHSVVCSMSVIPNMEIVLKLLKYGADVNYTDGNRDTPLKLAVQTGRLCTASLISFFIRNHIAAYAYIHKQNLKCLYDGKYSLALISRDIERMKLVRICADSYVTIFDLLTKSFKKLVQYMQNAQIKLALEQNQYEDEFPYWSGMIQARIQKAFQKSILFNQSHWIVRQIVNNVHELPELCTHKITSFLSDNDMKTLIVDFNYL